jgi:hypothetical protein
MNETAFQSAAADANFDELMKNFKLNCPIKKINLKLEEPNAIVGMWLLSTKDAIDRIKEKADTENLDGNTILFFTNQHIVELGNILFGMLSLVAANAGLNSSGVPDLISDYMMICKEIPTYDHYMNRVTNMIMSSIGGPESMAPIKEKIRDILYSVIFLPYNALDEFANEAIEGFQKSMGEKHE